MTDIKTSASPARLEMAVERDQLEILLKLQRDLLEGIAANVEVNESLKQACLAAEKFVPASFATVMTYDDATRSFHVLAAPSLSEAAIDALQRLEPCPGSCGFAVVRNRPVFVSDTRRNACFGGVESIRSCWSVPVRDRSGRVIGLFALFGTRTREPTQLHHRLLDACASLFGILMQRAGHESELRRLAHRDPLTGLANRMLLESSLKSAVDDARASHERIAVLFVDLDQFKNINDSLGHKIGDEVLVAVARRMEAVAPGPDTIARVGGDEFVIVLDSGCEEAGLEEFSRRLLTTIAEPIEVEGTPLYVNASIGISVFPRDGDTAGVLLQNADTALFVAKARGRNTYRFYEPEFTRNAVQRLETDREMRSAIDHDLFEYYFQPQVDVRTGANVAFEALIRWQHPARGVLEAHEFINAAERSGVLNAINMRLLTRAARSLVGWERRFGHRLRLVMNVSTGEIGPGYADQILAALAAATLAPEQLELEITERVFLSDDPVRIVELGKLAEHDVSLTMDDFGVGHSAFRDLVALPFARLKIAHSLVADLRRAPVRAIVKALLALAAGLGIEVVAEGVETAGQSAALAGLGCHLQQGRYHAPPMTAGDCERYLANLVRRRNGAAPNRRHAR